MTQDRFLGLDGLRGLAAIGVFLLHFGHAAGPMRLPGGYLAVDLFFLLSGFVLAHAYEARLKGGMTFWAFVKARVIRLYPLFLLGVVIGASVALAIVVRYQIADEVDWHERAGSFVSNLGFLPSVFHKYSPFPFNGPAWSLFYEMAASLLFALLAPRLGPRALALTIAAGFALLVNLAFVRGTLDGGAQHSSFWQAWVRVAFSFSLGVGCYRLWRWRNLRLRAAPLWAAAGLMIAIFAARPGEWKPVFEIAVAALAFPLILWVGASARPAGWAAKLCDKAGELSYPLYILHSPLIAAAAFVWLQLDWGNVRQMAWAPSVGVTLVIFAIAYAASAFYDKPLRRWLGRGGRGKPLGGAQAQPQEA